MATFKIEGLMTVFGERELKPENGHKATDWEVYLDGIKVKESLYDTVNLTEWHVGFLGNDGKPYDGTNGKIFGRARVYVNDTVSEYFTLVCPPKLSVITDSVIYPIDAHVLYGNIKIFQYTKPKLYGNIEHPERLTANVARPVITIGKRAF